MGKKGKPLIGFIGQGWVGRNYADDFEKRGYKVARYSLEEPWIKNKDKVRDCDIVFICVPTPTTPKGFDASIIEKALSLVGKGKTAVIKSTLLPGKTVELQKRFPNISVLCSPEFLTEATAAHDAANPKRNIIGIPSDTAKYRRSAQEVLKVLPKAPYTLVCKATEAELIKYGGNNWFYFKVIFINLLYDMSLALGCDFDTIRGAMAADVRIGASHLIPVHKSGTLGSDNFTLFQRKGQQGGRGAGGHCFIKDFAAFADLYSGLFPEDEQGIKVLRAIETKNIDLLISTGKDLDLLEDVYGAQALRKPKKSKKQ